MLSPCAVAPTNRLTTRAFQEGGRVTHLFGEAVPSNVLVARLAAKPALHFDALECIKCSVSSVLWQLLVQSMQELGPVGGAREGTCLCHEPWAAA